MQSSLNASSGSLAVATSVYSAFGGLLGQVLWGSTNQIPPTDPVGFGGQWGYYTDQSTGLVLMGHRYYNPSNGRFLTRDPIGYGGGINLYGFVGNNPITGIDPDGFSNKNKSQINWDDIIDAWNAWAPPMLMIERSNPGKDLAKRLMSGLGLGQTPVEASVKQGVQNPGEDDNPAEAQLGTRPTLPPRVIYSSRGVRIIHNYHDPLPNTPQEHAPAHLHVEGGGKETRIGMNGKPRFPADSELTAKQAKVVAEAKGPVRNAVQKIMKWLKWGAAAGEEAP